MRLQNRVAVITGAARGIGRTMALAFAQKGADIAIPDLDLEGAEATAAEIRQIGRKATAIRTDVSQKDQVQEMVKRVIRDFGHVDILVNNAYSASYGAFIDYPETEWEKTLNNTLKGYFLCGQAVAREMIKRQHGKIINISSVAGELALIRTTAYSVCKAGINIMTKVMSIELAPYGITVNAIAPGFIETPGSRAILSEADRQARIARIPLGRYGRPEDLTGAGIYLASSESDWTTGIVITVDGGFTSLGIS